MRSNFSFKNSASLSKPIRQASGSSSKITQLILISSVVVFFSFLVLKFFNLAFKKESLSYQKSEQELEPFRTFPLVVNLKGQEGPQLARVYVSITLTSDENKEGLLSESHQLKKQLLFLLSGQSVDDLEKEQFHSQIQSQLNAFLSRPWINKIRIQAEMLN